MCVCEKKTRDLHKKEKKPYLKGNAAVCGRPGQPACLLTFISLRCLRNAARSRLNKRALTVQYKHNEQGYENTPVLFSLFYSPSKTTLCFAFYNIRFNLRGQKNKKPYRKTCSSPDTHLCANNVIQV